jgi:hypothetical protein
MQIQTNFSFTGTASEFEEQGVKLNGKFLDKITVSNLAKHGILADAGEGAKPKRGRTPRKFTAVSNEFLIFSKSE